MSDRKSHARTADRKLDGLEKRVLRIVSERPGVYFAVWQTRFRNAAKRLEKLGRIKPGPADGWVVEESTLV